MDLKLAKAVIPAAHPDSGFATAERIIAAGGQVVFSTSTQNRVT